MIPISSLTRQGCPPPLSCEDLSGGTLRRSPKVSSALRQVARFALPPASGLRRHNCAPRGRCQPLFSDAAADAKKPLSAPMRRWRALALFTHSCVLYAARQGLKKKRVRRLRRRHTPFSFSGLPPQDSSDVVAEPYSFPLTFELYGDFSFSFTVLHRCYTVFSSFSCLF
jgi:hypothetical protein